jgi:hypothetical protein
MITVPELAADALSSFLASDMKGRFGSSYARLTELIPSVARLALECIGNSDALYHSVEHTMLVTLAGHDIMRGRVLLAPTLPDDYAHSSWFASCMTLAMYGASLRATDLRATEKMDSSLTRRVPKYACRADHPTLPLRPTISIAPNCS